MSVSAGKRQLRTGGKGRRGQGSSSRIGNDPRALWLTMALLVTATLIVFGSVVHFDFVMWDDPTHITQNPVYQPTPFAHLSYFWTHAYFGDYLPVARTVWAMLADASVGSSGRPITTFDPSNYHAANLCLHIANVLLVFFILRFFVKKDWAAALGALLFAIHPLQVEAVAWVSALRDLLGAFFSLLATLFYLMALQRAPIAQKLWLAGASVCYVLALLSKMSAAALPIMLLVLDYLLSRRPPAGRLLLLGLWLVASATVGLITRHLESVAAPNFLAAAFWQRPFIAGDAITFYLGKLFVPYPLGPDYGRTPTWVMSHAWAYSTILVPIALVILAWLFWKKAPWLAVAIGIFLIWLLPVCGIIPFVFQVYSTVADRYAYLAMLGPALVFAGLLSLMPWRRALCLGVVVLVCLGFLAARQVSAWANTDTLFRQALRANPHSGHAYLFLGLDNKQRADYDSAIPDFRKAVLYAPLDFNSHYDLGQALLYQWMADGSKPAQMGQLPEAAEQMKQALQLNQHSEPAYHYLGYISYCLKQYPQAVAAYRRAIEEDPTQPDDYYYLGMAYLGLGDTSDAEPYIVKAASMGYAAAQQALKASQGPGK